MTRWFLLAVALASCAPRPVYYHHPRNETVVPITEAEVSE